MVDALVTDAHLRSATWGVRGLARAGLGVLALSPSRIAAGRRSRLAAAHRPAPDARTDPDGLVAAVAAAGRELATPARPLVAFPGREASLDALLAADLPPEIALPFPGEAPVTAMRDKASLARLAPAAGLRVPAGLATGTAASFLADPPPLPCVVKPVLGDRGLGSAKVVADVAGLRAVLGPLDPDEPLLAQEHAGGPLRCLALVVDREGRVRAQFEHVARRTWPAAGGSGAVGVSTEPDPDVVERVRTLLAQAGFWGLAQVDLLGLGPDPALIDVNPRFYDSLALALRCGVDLPGRWHGVVTGAPYAAPQAYAPGVRFRWLEADLHRALTGDPRPLLHDRGADQGAMLARDDLRGSALLAADAVRVRLARRLPGRG